MIGWSPGPRDGLVIDIRSEAEPPWNRLSPDYQHGQVPIPGISGMYSDCVTGVMEGLKLVGPVGQAGKINPGYFVGPGRPRDIPPGSWFLGYGLAGRRVDLGTARRQILVPSYRWILWNKCYDLVAKLRELGQHQDVWIHDGIPNHDLDDPAALSCAFLLVEFLYGQADDLEKPLTLQ
jgi:hypothetical protein